MFVEVRLVQVRRCQRQIILAALGEGQFREQVPQIAVRLDSVGFRRLNQAVEGGAGMCSARRAAEKPVPSTDDERTDGVLYHICVRGQVRAVQIAQQLLPLSQRIVHRLAPVSPRDTPGCRRRAPPAAPASASSTSRRFSGVAGSLPSPAPTARPRSPSFSPTRSRRRARTPTRSAMSGFRSAVSSPSSAIRARTRSPSAR